MSDLPSSANALLALVIVVAVTWSVGAAAIKVVDRLPPDQS